MRQILSLFTKGSALLIFTLVISIGLFAQDEEYKKGENLFRANCASCHYPTAKKMTGPGLAGVRERGNWDDESKLYAWIKNSQAYLKTGDAYANALYEEYGKSVMTAQNLKDEEIAAVLIYIDNYVPPAGAVAAGPEVVEKELGITSPIVIFMLITAFVLFAIGFLLSKLLFRLKNMVREKEGLPALEPVSFKDTINSPKFKTLALILGTIFIAVTAFDVASNVGRQKDYAPTQPIEFSHKLHAGINGVDCQYCHSGARVGKSAVVPSANVCMNCHKSIESGPEYGTEEIAKIYKAVDWDKETQTYGDNPQPIEWVRIHNLPDHVYFNHAQHVNVGKIECQKCHGEVQEMDKVAQHASLGMGWCIDCHRETQVQFANNDYYKIYEQIHTDLKSGNKNKVTVEDIGGTECQKCHY